MHGAKLDVTMQSRQSLARIPSPFDGMKLGLSLLAKLHVVSPYLRQCTPPEFSVTLLPKILAIYEDESGAY